VETYLIRLGIDPKPKILTEAAITKLFCDAPWVSLHERSTAMTRLQPFLRSRGNCVMDNMNLDLRPPTPTRRQYTIKEMRAMRKAAETPYERFDIHLEQDYAARRITVLRSRVEDFDRVNETVILRVKGRGGNKTMEAPLNPDTLAILDAALMQREEVIAECRARGYKGPIPPEILLTSLHWQPRVIGASTLDNLLIRVCERAGVKARGHHANRRGAAKTVYDKTKDLVATQEFCGHADTKTTLIYIGAGLDRQRTAQAALAKVFA
jgi:integrase